MIYIKHKLNFPMGQRNFCRQNATYFWKPCVHFANGLLAYVSFCLQNRQIYTSRSELLYANFLIHEYSYLIHKANYLSHEAIYLIHEANYLSHEAIYLIHEANYLIHEAIYLIHEANYLIQEADAIIFST
jgi:hypothetical protein